MTRMGDFDKSDVYIIPVEQLKPNPWNPNEMGETAWQALGQSIVKHGIHLQPLVVRPHGDGFQIIDGEHRYKWACEMGIPSVSAVVADVDDFQAKKLTQILNRVRGEDNPIQLKELLDSLLVDHTPDEVIEGMAIANEQELNHLLADLEKQIMSDYEVSSSDKSNIPHAVLDQLNEMEALAEEMRNKSLKSLLVAFEDKDHARAVALLKTALSLCPGIFCLSKFRPVQKH